MKLRRAVLALVLLLPPVALGGPKGARGAAEGAYQAARHAYYVLKADAARRKFRHNWQNVAGRFELVAARYPQSPRAADALFTAAQMREELSRISMLEEDLHAALADYQKLVDQHGRDRLADDAAYAIGKIQVDRLDSPEAARKALTRGIEQNPHGDRLKAMKTLLASLGEAPPRPVAKRVVPSTPPVVVIRPAPHADPVHADPAHAEPARAEPAHSTDATAARASAPHASTAIAEALTRAAEETQDGPPSDGDATDADSVAPPSDDDSSAESEAPTTATTASRPAIADRAVDGGKPTSAQSRARLKKAQSQQGGEITLAEQLGLKVRRVVIDAGHGGHDSGAVGRGGTLEKDVSLAIAKRVGDILASAGLEVLLTRDDDTFVRLEDRAKIANEAKGDLFISIHCNSAQSRKLRGIETYTLNTSSDRYSIRLAARENSSSEKGISDLQFILADLATKANTEESTRLATRVQHNLVGHLASRYSGVKDLGTKEALFYVLLGARMPAILVETSFLSNPEDEKRLGSKSYQEDVAQSVAAGVQDFLGNRQRVAKVD